MAPLQSIAELSCGPHWRRARQLVRKRESTRARNGSGSWKGSFVESVARDGAIAIILNWEIKQRGHAPGGRIVEVKDDPASDSGNAHGGKQSLCAGIGN